MAKVTFLQGKARGKVGGIVYRTIAGIGTVASEYNPSPRNPRTMAQVKQRSKMNLAGQMSKITPFAAIAGLSASRRVARQEFVSNLLKSISDNGELTYSWIDQQQLILSKGVAVPCSGSIASGAQAGSVDISYGMQSAGESVLGGILVVYGSADEMQPMCIVRKLEATSGTENVTLSDFGASSGSEVVLAAFVIPILDKGDNARDAFGQLTFELNGFKTEYTRTLVAAGAYAASKMIDTKTVEA